MIANNAYSIHTAHKHKSFKSLSFLSVLIRKIYTIKYNNKKYTFYEITNDLILKIFTSDLAK